MAAIPYHKLSPIPKKYILEMIAEYKKTLHKLSTESLKARFPNRKFSDGTPLQDTISTWVSREDIMKLLDDNKADGLRLQLGCHSRSTVAVTGEEYLGMLAVILIPTKNTSERMDAQAMDTLKDSTEINFVSEFSRATLQASSFEGNGGDMLPLCPPRCPK